MLNKMISFYKNYKERKEIKKRAIEALNFIDSLHITDEQNIDIIYQDMHHAGIINENEFKALKTKNA